jgi:hypothetical protein
LSLVAQALNQRATVLAIVSASAAFSGLVLVFLGVLVTSYQGLLGRVGEQTLHRFKNATWIALAVFLAGVVSVALGIAWLAAGGGHALYVFILVSFFMELGALAFVAWYSTARVLLRG